MIVCGESLHEMTDAYRAGALAMRRNVPWRCNPHRSGSQRADDWAAGHEHEAAGERLRFGLDLVLLRCRGDLMVPEDPEVPRDGDGQVDEDWYAGAISKAGPTLDEDLRARIETVEPRVTASSARNL